MRTNYLTKREAMEIEKTVAQYKDEFSKLQGKSDMELTEAGAFMINDYIAQNPDVLMLSDLLFNRGEVNQQNMTLEVEVGYGGTAYVHDIGSEAVFAQTYIDRVNTKLKRFSFASKVDVNAMKNQNIVKLLEDAAEIRYKLFLAKMRYVWDLVAATITSGSPIYITAASVNKTNLDSVMNTMMDVAGGVRAIVGRQSLITQIQGFTGWSDFTLRDIEQGIFGQYKGAKLIGLQDVKTTILDAAGNKFETSHIPANQLILIGEKCGFDGENPVKTMTEQNALLGATISNTFFDYAAIIVDDRKLGVYNIA